MDALYPLETGYYQISDEEAPNYAPSVVPASLRVKSLILTFLEGINRPAAYQFFGASTADFNDKYYWKKMAYFADIHSISLISEMIQLSAATWNASKDGTATTLAAATDACPADVRKMGLNIILKNSAGKWEAWQFIGTSMLAQFEDTDYWKQKDLQPDVYNLSVNVPAVEGYYTMDKDDSETPYAPDYVPVENRKVGLLITFMSYTGWQTWQYKGIEAIIGEVLESDWLNSFYWQQKDAEYLLTKAVIEEKLTGDIETHTHGHLNQLCELVAVRTTDPDIFTVQYEQGAKYYNSHTNFIHTLDYSDEVNPWYYAEQPKVGVLYYSLSDESSSYAKLWRYTGTEMLEIPVHPSLAFDAAQRETAVNVANVDDIHAVTLTPQTNNIQYIVIPSNYALSTVFIELIMDSIISGMFIMDLYVCVESSAVPGLNLSNTSEVLGRYLYFKPGYSVPATLAKGLHHFTFVRDMSELVNVNLYVEHTYTAAS